MNLTDMLAQAGGLQSIARELDIHPEQAASGAAALLPAILGGFQKQAQSGGSGGFLSASSLRVAAHRSSHVTPLVFA